MADRDIPVEQKRLRDALASLETSVLPPANVIPLASLPFVLPRKPAKGK